MYSMSPKSGPLMTDEQVMERFKQGKEWGLLVSLDLHDCDPKKIRDGDYIRKFSVDLCNHIKMKRFGEPIVVRFGADPKVQGYSLAQLIETSLISGHFAEDTNRAFIDVFSCKEYPPKAVADYCAKYFGAKKSEYSISFRT
jgi:S-adenosylmethionine/arginine decarboxylase-like enzyme